MGELRVCVYCRREIDPASMFWILERWENGRCVARGAIDHPGCLHGTTGLQGPRTMPLVRGELPGVDDRVVEESVAHGPEQQRATR
jgi:hypothetical protein